MNLKITPAQHCSVCVGHHVVRLDKWIIIKVYHMMQITRNCSNVTCMNEATRWNLAWWIICAHMDIQCRNSNRTVFMQMCWCMCVYGFTQLLRQEKDVTQGQFLSEVQWFKARIFLQRERRQSSSVVLKWTVNLRNSNFVCFFLFGCCLWKIWFLKFRKRKSASPRLQVCLGFLQLYKNILFILFIYLFFHGRQATFLHLLRQVRA